MVVGLLNPSRFAAGGPVVLPTHYGAISYTEKDHYAGHSGDRVYDKDSSTLWAANSNPSWIVIRYSMQFVATEYSLLNQSSKDWVFQGSNDGSSWTTLDTRTNQVAGYFRYTFSNSTAYEYYRFNNVTPTAGNVTGVFSDICIQEDRVMSASAISNDIGYDPKFGSQWLPANPGWHDFNLSSSGRWYQVDLGGQIAVAMARYGFKTANLAGWTLHGSNDVAFGTSTLLDTQSGNTTTGQVATGTEVAFAFANTTVFRYFRITGTAMIGGGTAKMDLSRVRFLPAA